MKLGHIERCPLHLCWWTLASAMMTEEDHHPRRESWSNGLGLSSTLLLHAKSQAPPLGALLISLATPNPCCLLAHRHWSSGTLRSADRTWHSQPRRTATTS